MACGISPAEALQLDAVEALLEMCEFWIFPE